MKKILLMTMMLLGVSGMAFAGGPHDDDCMKGKGYHHGKHERMLERKLDLSEAQKASIQQIRDEYRDQMKGQKGERGHGYGGFMELDPQDPNYQEQVQTLARERADAVEQKILLNAEKHAKIYAVLTEEQREELKALHEKRKEKFKERYKNRME